MAALENAKYENFIQAIAEGMSQRQAYLKAFPNSSRWKFETVDNKASKLFNTDEVQARYKELQEAAADAAILSRKDRMIILSSMAEDLETPYKIRVQAIDVLNKMDGQYIKRVEASVTTSASETAAAVAAILDE